MLIKSTTFNVKVLTASTSFYMSVDKITNFNVKVLTKSTTFSFDILDPRVHKCVIGE